MRVTRGQVKRKKHNKVLKDAKGYAHAKSHRYRMALNQLEKSMQYATSDRKRKKREMRKLWITRVNIACREHDMSYSTFMNGLKKANVALNRKSIQEIANLDPEAVKELVAFTQASK